MNTDTLFKIKIDGNPYEVSSPVVTGQELLKWANKTPRNEYAVYLHLENGDMESIRPTEAVDLSRKGIEQFQTFKTDVIYRLEINGAVREWGADIITGKALKRLAGVEQPDDVGVWQQIRGADDRLIADQDRISLSTEGLERFRTGVRFSICIEGNAYEWPKDVITTEEIMALGGWDVSQGAIEVDKDQNERTLQPGEVIRLKPGHNFCKKQRFKRGLNMESRIGQEFVLLQKNFSKVEYKEVGGVHWFKISGYPLPPPLSPNITEVVFSVTAGHPVPKPYGFFVAAGVKHGQTLLSLGNPPHSPPFDGTWRFVSWDPENWMPGGDVATGSNLWGWVRSFRQRLLEGE